MILQSKETQFLFVVVLYEMPISEAPTLRSLVEQRSLLRQRGIRILVIDNTPGEKPVSSSIDSETDYLAVGENMGVAGAYQAAFLKARDEGCSFLVLLDQDSEVNSRFIDALDEVRNERMSAIGIWCPNIVSWGRPICPYSLNTFGWPNFFPPRSPSRLYGINSFSVVKIKCIEAIGGFDQFYWLDCLDFWLYETAQRNGWRVKRLGVTMNHDLSIVSGKISIDRMKNIAFYESCFVIEYGSVFRAVGGVLRLALKGLRRIKLVGGVCGYGYYLLEIFKGMQVGLGRRGRSNAE